jgi:CheY-like chemotaxis protein/HAMP domain-containing protein
VKGVAGVWKDLTDNVNVMASNLTNQVRRIAIIVTAVANGDLKRKLVLEARGEIATLAETINDMIDTLATFADQVTSVAREVGVEGKLGGQARVPGATGIWRDLTDNVNQLAANLTTQVRAIADVATAVTKGDLTRSIEVIARGEVEALKDNINEMIRNLRETTQKSAEQDWLKTNLAKFSRMLQGQRDLETVCRQILSEMAPLVGAQQGLFYSYDEGADNPTLRLLSTYAATRESCPAEVTPGDGLVGQCALDRKPVVVEGAPGGYFTIQSGLGEAHASNIVVLPVLFENQMKGVLELASFNRFNDVHINFLEQLTESIGIVLNTIAATMRTEALLKQSQALTTELQTTNVELEEKAEQLALTSKYKSDFLANMSHELRTPLNSLLILAKMLYENPGGNLTEKQVEFARAIHSSGTDLLSLINDILDLSKIESGTMAVEIGRVGFKDLQHDFDTSFRPLAQNKKLDFAIEIAPELPSYLETDSKRLHQVLRNLLSNAFKFTSRGGIWLRINTAQSGWSPHNEALNRAEAVVAFSVRDTGIGIPDDKHRIIFEPFHQADMTTSRKYGGTGLGLSISREIARMLGGEIRLDSSAGAGSTFTLFLPLAYVSPKATRARELTAHEEASDALASVAEPAMEVHEMTISPPQYYVDDDRSAIEAGDRVILIVEDDLIFAKILLDVAREQGFKGVIAVSGETGLTMARKLHPHAISLDVRTPDMDGWSLLDCLKHDPDTRHIPVQVVSGVEDLDRGLKLGAFACLRKPLAREEIAAAFARIQQYLVRTAKQLLLVEDDALQRAALSDLLGGSDVEITAVGSGSEAMAALRSGSFDCVVLDLRLPDMSGLEVLDSLRSDDPHRPLPVIVHTGKDLTAPEEMLLRRRSEAIVVKDAMSPERLLAETSLYLHRPASGLPETSRAMLRAIQTQDPILAERTVLIADDDVRNIFALSTVLERSRMKVRYVQNGREAVDALAGSDDIDIVLMDIMMPEMDGYEAMREIRHMDRHRSLPIIALTAKAMKGDRERCIAAGASDYIPKPVDTERLLSLLRVWLHSMEGIRA